MSGWQGENDRTYFRSFSMVIRYIAGAHPLVSKSNPRCLGCSRISRVARILASSRSRT